MAPVLFATDSSVMSSVAMIIVFGVGCLWLASRLKIPSILLLLPAGVVVGPVLGLLDPDEKFGVVLFPIVSLGVGILLFEGGLGLRFDRVGAVSSVVGRLVTVGAFLVWVVAGLTVFILFDVPGDLAALIGALLVVSGPTVVQPLLRLAKPRPSVAEVLRWEGIVIDPIGATLGVVLLEVFLGGSSVGAVVPRILLTLIAGGLIGGGLGLALAFALGRHWVPDHLHNPLALAVAVGSFALADLVASEAGLMATTALGLVMANQRRTPSRHIREFEEELGVLVLGGLFLLLGARVDLQETVDVLPNAFLLTLVLIFIARPIAVAASTLGSSLTTRERMFMVFVAPRGIVAAAVASVFALEIEAEGFDPGPLVPVVFSVIVLTVLFYGFAAVPAARYLRVARPPTQAVAIVGADRWHLRLAEQLQDAGVSVLLFTDRAFERRRAQESALLAYVGELDHEGVEEAADALGIKTVLILTDRAELVAAVAPTLAPIVGRANVFAAGDRSELEGAGVASALTFRPADGIKADVISRLESGAEIMTVDRDDLSSHDVVIASLRGAPITSAHFDGSEGDRSVVVRVSVGASTPTAVS